MNKSRIGLFETRINIYTSLYEWIFSVVQQVFSRQLYGKRVAGKTAMIKPDAQDN